jgi:TonB-dependent SusC/RagA subfamily outer membrane receptor
MSAPAVATAQGTGTIHGVVRDAATGRPLAGVQMYVLDSRLVGETDAEGRYEIPNVPAGNVSVGARIVGYSGEVATLTLTATLPAELDFELRRSVVELDVVVVTGTGASMEVKQLGNTVGTVDMERIETAPIQTFSEALAAREPSVTVSAAGGLAGAGARIRIRGSNSMSLSNEPVVFLDGVMVDNGGGMTNVASNAAGPSRLDDINPDAIDRIEILKGAAASTLYGSVAASGVIQIFTKTGRRGAPRFSLRVEEGISQYPDVIKPNAGFARDQAQADRINEVYSHTPGWTDVSPYEVFERTFAKDLFETGRQHVVSLNVTGGTEAVNYFAAGRFTHDNGPVGGESLGPSRDINRKIQGNANITVFPRERLSFRIGALFTATQQELPRNGNNIYAALPASMLAKPEQAMCDDGANDGVMDVTSSVIGATTPTCESTGNPTGSPLYATPREALQATTTQRAEHFNGNLAVSYQAAQSLSLDGTFGIDITHSRDEGFYPYGWNVDGITNNYTTGARFIGQRSNHEASFGLASNWSTRIGNSVSSQFTSGVGGLVTTNETTGADAIDMPGPGLEVVEAASNQTAYEQWYQVVGLGAYVQEQLGFFDYIYLTAGAQWGRQSTFGENAGATIYPKASVSIVPSDMPSWPSGLLSTLRIRAAFGKSGMQPSAYDKYTTYEAGITPQGGALVPDNLGNEDLAPEVSTEWEAGTELGLFDNRIGAEVTYWHRVTSDALVLRQYPLTGGFYNEQLDNIGELRGRGWELSFDWLAVDAEQITVNLFAAASYIKERITDMGSAPPLKLGGTYPRYRNYLMPPLEMSPGDTTYYAPGS